MNYIKTSVTNLIDSDPMAFMKSAAQGLDAYFEYYSLVEYKNITKFINEFGRTPFFQVIGGSGCGKTSFKTIIENIFDENVNIFSYNCSDITELDDIFYSFYKFTLKYPIKKELFRNGNSSFNPASLDEQIINYIKNIPQNTVLIFDNFEMLSDDLGEMKAANTKSFFEYISNIKNIKIIFLTSIDIKNTFEIFGNKFSSIYLKNLNETEIKDFFAIFKTDVPQSLLKEIQEKTNGCIYSLKLLAVTSKVLDLPIPALLKEVNSRKENIDEYNIKKLISKLSDDAKKVLYYITTFRHGISLAVLKSIDNFSNLQEAIYALKTFLLIEGDGKYESRQLIKNYVYNAMSPKEKMNFHEKIADMYANQIPLKPSERVLDISRTSMYAEKFYHYNVFSKWSKSLSLQNTRDYNPQKQQEIKPDAQTIKYIASTQYLPDFDNKDKKDEIFEPDIPGDSGDKVVEKDVGLDIASTYKPMKDILSNTSGKNSLFDLTNNPNNEMLDMIEDEDYKKAQELLDRGMTLYNDGNSYESISAFEEAIPILKDKENDGFWEAKYMLARAYSDNFKHKEAMNQLNELLELDIPTELKIETYLEMANVYDSQDKLPDVIETYNKALSIAKDKNLIAYRAKTYFRIGLFYDERNNPEKALYNYLLSATDAAELEDKSMLASTYSNIASLYEDKGEISKAGEFYNKSLKIDESYNNYEGQTKTLSLLASIYKRKGDINNSLQLLYKATQIAKQTNDNYIIASSYLELGDAFLDKKDYKNALKAYILSKKNIDNTISTDSKYKIERRFKMIVDEIGENAYRFLLQELKSK